MRLTRSLASFGWIPLLDHNLATHIEDTEATGEALSKAVSNLVKGGRHVV